MGILGWLIILLEVIGHLFPSSPKTDFRELSNGISDFAFIIAGASLIIVDRIKPITVKDKPTSVASSKETK